jgi:tRNA (mo5U34)-methyltransferase
MVRRQPVATADQANKQQRPEQVPDRLAKLFEGVHWHQRWELQPGIFTPGGNDVIELMDWARVPSDLTGKRVLDIGPWNGCFSLECERRGAAEVIALGPEFPEHTGFLRLRDYLGSRRVEYRVGTIYDLQPERLGYFDVVICFGVIYHLRHPLLGFDMMRRIAKGDLFLESKALDHDVRVDGNGMHLAEINPLLSSIPIMEFFQKDELNGDASNWFSPNLSAVRAFLESSGFQPLHIALHRDRLAAHAKVIPGEPEWLQLRTSEAVYDTVIRPVLGARNAYH